MACGIVPVVGDLPQLHEWINHGLTGFFIPQNDKARLAYTVNYLYRNRQTLSEMSGRCISKIRAQGYYEACMEHTRELLKSLT
jgi:glycosyltransferase involved in cell wall biosynthesis